MTTFGDKLFHSGGVPVGGDLFGLLAPTVNSRIIYLDPASGDDGNEGRKPTTGVATLSRAEALCEAGTDSATGAYPTGGVDVIIRMPGTEELSAAVTTTTPNVVLVASTCGQQLFGDRLANYTVAASGMTTSILNIYHRNWSVYGISWGGRGTHDKDDQTTGTICLAADSGITGMQSGGGGQFNTFAYNSFRDAGGADGAGIFIYGGGPTTIYKNRFGYGPLSLGPVGIQMRGSGTNNPTDIYIVENSFVACPIGIGMGNNTIQSLQIEGNIFNGCTNGIHFYAGTTATVGLLVNNRFSTTVAAESWQNDGGSGDTQANIVSDTGIEFAGNMYGDDDNNQVAE